MTCHCLSHYLIQHSSECFLKLHFFMEENKSPTHDQHSEKLLDDSSSDDDSPDPSLKTTEEERCGTIPGSQQATAMALMCTRAQANPTVERGKPIK